MADLTGQTPAATYKGLLQVNDYTDGVDATAKYIQDGEGTDSALAISTDKVGIGTANPTSPLTIDGSPSPYMSFDNTQANSVADTSLGAVFFKGKQPDGTVDTGAAVRAFGAGTATNSSNDVPAKLVFSTNPGGTSGLEDRMIIESDGNVGIGTTSTGGSRLFVKGDQTNAANISISADNSVGEKDASIFFNATRGVNNAGSNGEIRVTHDGGSGLGKMLFSTRRGSGDPTTAMTIDSTGNVGIGTTSPDGPLDITSPASPTIFFNESTNTYQARIGVPSLTGNVFSNSAIVGSLAIRNDTAIQLGASTPAVTIKDGKVGIGTASPDSNLDIDGTLLFSTNPTNSAWMLETGINGLFVKEKVGSSFTSRLTFLDGGNVTPGTDDAQDFGSATKRWDDIYATNGTIDTSDRELKQDIEELSEAETRVAQACKGLLRKYRWKNSVAEKGDDARIHFGIMAQDLAAAFAAEGLDAGRYGMFIKNTWWEADRVVPAVEAVEAIEAVYDEEGNEVSPAVEAVEAQPERTELDIFNNIEDAPEGAIEVTQRGVRYAELLAFIIAAI